MLRLVDLPHAPLSELIEHDVVAYDQSAGLALENGLGLELGQLALAEHFPSQRLGIRRAFVGRQGGQECMHFCAGHQAAVGQRLDADFQGGLLALWR